MARLPCSVTFDLRTMIDEGNEHKARELVVQRLREGFASPEFLALVADMLDPPKRPNHRPKKIPSRWYEIGKAHEERTDSGMNYLDSIADLASEFSMSEASIKRRVDYYLPVIRSVRETEDEILREEAAK
jgi:hypothetical protein